MTNTVIVIVGLSLLAFIILAGMLARMFRKAGPNEALIVYGFRGPRVIKGHGTVIFPMVENCRELSLELMSLRRGAAAGSLHQAGRRGDGGSRGADQGAQRSGIDPDRGRAVSHQDAAAARRPDPPGDGRPSARHHRPADGGADCERAGDGRRSHARHLRGRHEQDGTRSGFVHHQGGARQERIHHQHGPAGHRPHQARRGDRDSRSRARHRDPARECTAGGRRRQGGRPIRSA